MVYDIVVAGSACDPNIMSLLDGARRKGLSALGIVHDSVEEPNFRWDADRNDLMVDGAPVNSTGIFIRFDVFTPPAEETPESGAGSRDRAMAWYTALSAWAFVAGVRCFNAGLTQAASLKPVALAVASQHGLSVPDTLVSNRRDDIASGDPLIVKPVGGGAYTVHANDVRDDTDWRDGLAAAPAFIQEELSYPEYRVYVIGDQVLSYETYASNLDFRLDRTPQTRFMTPGELDRSIVSRLRAVAQAMHLDFCAFDLKTRKSTGELCFLEVNSSPMFTAFDALAGGALSATILDHLTKPS